MLSIADTDIKAARAGSIIFEIAIKKASKLLNRNSTMGLILLLDNMLFFVF